MQKLPAIALAFLILTGCKKKDEQSAAPAEVISAADFKYLPVKDAVWKIHTQGEFDKNLGKVDTAVYYHYTITTMGSEAIVEGIKYFKYKIETKREYRKPLIHVTEQTEFIYLREDTARQRIYASGNPEIIVVDFAQEEIGDDADVPQQWPQSFVSEVDSLIVAKQYLKAWNVSYKYDNNKKYFYKAYGIGRQTGVLPFITLGSQPISLDFTYKNETLHFDFEFHK